MNPKPDRANSPPARRRNPIRALLPLLLAFGLTSCSALVSAVTREALEVDIVALFRERGGLQVRPSCEMQASTQTGICLMSATNREVAGLVGGLGLQPVRSEEDRASISAWEARGGCRRLRSFAVATNAVVYRSAGAIEGLPSGTGASFEYLLLYHKAETGELCAQASYTEN